jgi:AGCS family alanine or glycine:cation symporter
VLHTINDCLWEYIDFTLIILIGLYLTVKSRFFQIKTLLHPLQTFHALIRPTDIERKKGITPIRLYFTSMGGSVGVGNVGGIVAAVSIGGPGGLFWMWVAVFVGMLVKYSEIFLGIKYRSLNKTGGYDGGAMYYLSKAFKWKFIPVLFCILMCIYGTEIYQFKVVEDAIVNAFNINRYVVMLSLLAGTGYVIAGGVNRLSVVCSVLMPFFLLIYAFVCVYVICCSGTNIRTILADVLRSAFTGHAAVGGFLGSSCAQTIQQGMSNAIYSGDIGMGYDSVIQSETQLNSPHAQAKSAIFTLLTDCVICTLTVLLVLCTGQWKSGCTHGFDCVVSSLSPYFPYVKQLMAMLFFLAGWTTILGYLSVALKSAKAISEKAIVFYFVYAVCSFVLFSFLDQNFARLVMFIAGGVIMLFNLCGIFKLRKEIHF